MQVDATATRKAGRHVDYWSGTEKNHKKSMAIAYQVQWLDKKELPDNVYSSDALLSIPGLLTSEFSKPLEKVDEIQSIEEMRRSRKASKL